MQKQQPYDIVNNINSNTSKIKQLIFHPCPSDHDNPKFHQQQNTQIIQSINQFYCGHNKIGVILAIGQENIGKKYSLLHRLQQLSQYSKVILDRWKIQEIRSKLMLLVGVNGGQRKSSSITRQLLEILSPLPHIIILPKFQKLFQMNKKRELEYFMKIFNPKTKLLLLGDSNYTHTYFLNKFDEIYHHHVEIFRFQYLKHHEIQQLILSKLKKIDSCGIKIKWNNSIIMYLVSKLKQNSQNSSINKILHILFKLITQYTSNLNNQAQLQLKQYMIEQILQQNDIQFRRLDVKHQVAIVALYSIFKEKIAATFEEFQEEIQFVLKGMKLDLKYSIKQIIDDLVQYGIIQIKKHSKILLRIKLLKIEQAFASNVIFRKFIVEQQ